MLPDTEPGGGAVRKFNKLIPILGSLAWVAMVLMRLAGASGEAAALEGWLNSANIPTAVSPVEIAATLPVMWGIGVWIRKRWRAWRHRLPLATPSPLMETQAEWESLIHRYQYMVAAGEPWDIARAAAASAVILSRASLEKTPREAL
jgi:hypothetical protein